MKMRKVLAIALALICFSSCLFTLASCKAEEERVPVLKQQRTEFDLTVGVHGNGTVDKTSGTFEKGESVTVTATPSEGYRFKQWLDTKHNVLSTALSYTVTFGKNDIGLIAEFEAIPTLDNSIPVENEATIKDTDVDTEKEESFYKDTEGETVVQTVAHLENCPANLSVLLKSTLPLSALREAISLTDLNDKAVVFNLSEKEGGVYELTSAGGFKGGYSYTLKLSDGVTLDGYANEISTLNFNIELSQDIIDTGSDAKGNYVIELENTTDIHGVQTIIEAGRTSAELQNAAPIFVALVNNKDFRQTLAAAAIAAEQCGAAEGGDTVKKTMLDIEKGNDGSYTLNISGNGFTLVVTFRYQVNAEVSFTAQAKKQGGKQNYEKIQYNPITLTEVYGLDFVAYVGSEQVDKADFAKKVNDILYADGSVLNDTMNTLSTELAKALDVSGAYTDAMDTVHAGTRNFDIVFAPSFVIKDFRLNGFGALSFETTVVSKISYTLTEGGTPYRDYSVSRTQTTKMGDGIAFVGSLSFKLDNTTTINQSGKNTCNMPNHANGNYDVRINTSFELQTLKGIFTSGLNVGTIEMLHTESIDWKFNGRVERSYSQASTIYSYTAPYADAILGYNNRIDSVEVSPSGVKLIDLRLFDVKVYNPKTGTFVVETLSPESFTVSILKGGDKIKYENGKLTLTDASALSLNATISISCNLAGGDGRFVNLPPRIINVRIDKKFDIDSYLDAYYKSVDTDTEASFRAIYRAASPETRELVVGILKDVLNKIEIAPEYKDMSNAIIERYFSLLYDLVDEYKQNTDTYARQWENEFVKEATTFDTLVSFTNLVIADKGAFDEKSAKALAESVLDSRLMKGAAEYIIESDAENQLWTKLKEKYATSSESVKVTVNEELAERRATGDAATLETVAIVERLLGITE